jgi:hypothetical protein
MPLKDEHILARRGFPDPNFLVRAAAGDALTVGAEGHALRPTRRSFECDHFLSRGRVPHLDCLVRPSAEEMSPVGTERHTVNAPDVPLER